MELTISSKQLANMGIPDLPLEAFGGMRPLPRAMVSAGLGMTYHKGGAAKWIAPVVMVAAAIAIPYAAPAIVTALSGSASIAAATATMGTTLFTAASAAVGAGLGALAGVASAAISGQNMGRSALFGAVGGAIGGGLSGYSAATNAATAAQTAAPTTGAVGAVEAAAPSVVPTELVQVDAAGNAFNGITGEALVQTPEGFVAATQAAPSGGIGAQLSNTGGTEYAPLGGDTAAQTTTAPQAGLSTANAPTPELAQVTASPAGDVVNGVQTGANAGAVSQTTAAAGDAATKAPLTFGEALKKVPETIAAKFSNPEALADMTLRAAGQLAGSAIAGDGLSPEEQQLLNAQRAELEQLRGTNQQLFQERLQAAQNLLGEAKYFDPEYFGLQSQRRIQTAAGLQTQEALRKISPQRAGLRAAEERRARLGTTLAGETAYLQGADTAEQNRIRTTQAGINALPTSAPAGSLQYGQYMGGLYDVAYNRRTKEAAGIGSFIGGLTGTSKSGSLFS